MLLQAVEPRFLFVSFNSHLNVVSSPVSTGLKRRKRIGRFASHKVTRPSDSDTSLAPYLEVIWRYRSWGSPGTCWRSYLY